MTSLQFPILLLAVIIILFGALIAWVMSRRFKQDLGVNKEEREKQEDVGFIINAFHSVTKELKEKEKELERLRAIAEQRAENIESFNENVLQCVTSGVITFDRMGSVISVNRAAEEMLGISSKQVVNKHCSDIFGEGDICSDVGNAIERKRMSVRSEAVFDLPEGRLWLGYNTAVLMDRKGESLGVILSFSNLTEVKRLQEQVDLRERLTALGEMSAGIAHELRNPMAVISGYLRLIAKKADGADRKIISDVQNEISGMNRIIDDLLMFARPASLNRVPLQLKELVEGCLASVLQAKGNADVIECMISLPPVEIFADEVLLRQAFTNLIQNAVEAMPQGGRLGISGNANPTHCMIAISDTGPGIPRDRVKKIFLPFFTSKDTGVGMGLALVHKIITSHSGRIEVKSTEGRGAVFQVILPIR